MKLSAIFALSLTALAAAAPLAEPEAELEEREVTHFKLKTKLHANQGANKDRFNNKYISTFHTGAGLNDIVLTSKESSEYPMVLNGTKLAFVFDKNAPKPEGYFGVGIGYEAESQWAGTSANIGYGEKAFKINGNKLVGKKSKGWYGWRVCDWNHGSPQLFYLTDILGTPKVTPGCANVDLIIV